MIIMQAPRSGPTLLRQRMTKSSWNANSSAWTIVPSWTSDPSHPATIVSHKLIVQGSGVAVVSATATRTNLTSEVRILRNGAVIGSGTLSSATPVYTFSQSMAVAEGDQIWMEIAAASTVRTITNMAIDVTPA